MHTRRLLSFRMHVSGWFFKVRITGFLKAQENQRDGAFLGFPTVAGEGYQQRVEAT